MDEQLNVIQVFVADKIAFTREQRKMTQTQLSKKVGISRASIVNMESYRQAISLTRLYDIATVLNVSIHDLLPDMAFYRKNKGKKIRRVISYEIED